MSVTLNNEEAQHIQRWCKEIAEWDFGDVDPEDELSDDEIRELEEQFAMDSARDILRILARAKRRR